MKNHCLKNVTPTLCSCAAAAGVIATSALAVRATPKAVRKIRSNSRINHDGDPDAYTKIEAIRSAWTCYVPATVVGVSTIACIFGAELLNKRQRAAITSAYALLNNAYNNYKSKTKEIFGEEAHQKILDAVAADDVYISSSGICGSHTLSFSGRNQDDRKLFYDSFSERYFESTIPQVLEAEYHLNRNWALGGEICINDLYDFFGIDEIPGGEELCWFYEDGISWIDFNHHITVIEDGLEVFVIEIEFPPRMATEND